MGKKFEIVEKSGRRGLFFINKIFHKKELAVKGF